MLGPGGIYEGVISTYREGDNGVQVQAQRAPNPSLLQPLTDTSGNTSASDAVASWEQAYSQAVADGGGGGRWREALVVKALRDAPDWVQRLVVASCNKSNLFRDAATSPKLDRLARLLAEADLRAGGGPGGGEGDRELAAAMRFPFPPSLSTAPVVEETVHADEAEFVDCGVCARARRGISG